MRHEVGHAMRGVSYVKPMNAYKNLTDVMDMYVNEDQAVNKQMKCNKLYKNYTDRLANLSDSDRINFILAGVIAIPKKNVSDYKLLVALILKEKNVDHQIKLLNILLGT